MKHHPIARGCALFIMRPARMQGTGNVEISFKDDFHTRGGPPFKTVEVTSRRRQ